MSIESPVFRITDLGITAPTYPEILEYFKEKARGIFGDDINLTEDTQDGQLLAIFAAALHDVNAEAVEVFSAYNPQTAHGNALDAAIKTNGITRRIATHSTVDVTIVGQQGTVIADGKVKDSLDNSWLLPEKVVIPAAGSITVTATAEAAGAISAPAGSVTQISTPTRGWQSVSNAQNAIEGVDAQSDADLRNEQTRSTMQPTVGLWDGLMASLSQLDGVTSVAGRQNDSGEATLEGIPAHSIACVVAGGTVEDIIRTIWLKKSQGVPTYGSIEREYLDSLGNVNAIRFSRPTDVSISVALRVKAGSSWLSTIEDEIKARIVAYVEGLGIGVSVNAPRLLSALIETGTGLDTAFDVESITLNGSVSSVSIAWNQVATCSAANITITVD